MALTIDATSTSTAGGSPNVTWSHTCTGESRALFVGVGIDDGSTSTVSGVTYAGTAMTQVNTKVQGAKRSYIFYLVNPTLGANNIIATTNASECAGYGISFNGAEQNSTVIDNSTTGGGSGTDPSTNIVTNVNGCIVIDAVEGDSGEGVGANQSQIINLSTGFSTVYGSSESAATAGTITMSWTGGGGITWAQCIVSVKPETRIVSAQPILKTINLRPAIFKPGIAR